MKINENGVTREMTEEEEELYEKEQRQIAEEAEHEKLEYAASPAGRTEAQAYFTAVMTDTLLEE